jgi:peptidoglycan/xylan/chitin deacetylase (PgdA/CDA1 family)
MLNISQNLSHDRLLRGHYEAECHPGKSNCAHVPDFAYNILNRLGLLYRPIVDEDRLAQGAPKPVWPEGKSFAVCLTHDVDEVSSCSWRQNLRARLAEIRESRSVRVMIRNVVGSSLDLICLSNSPDPLHCYERWLNIENSYHARSTFFFWPGGRSISKRHSTDCLFEMTDKVVLEGQKCTVAEMIQEIDRRGWEIGLHPSWFSFDDLDELKRQKEGLEKIVGHDVVSVRQHYLRYDIRLTPGVQAQAGFKYDSSLGFNDNIGFRFGTSYPWRLYDLQEQKESALLEIPLIIQDGALLNPDKGLRLDVDTAMEYAVQLTAEVERVGGVLTLLWHPNHIIKTHWWELYLRILEHLKHRQAWFASVKSVGEWWAKHEVARA